MGRRRNCGSISRARLIPSSKCPDGCGAQNVSYSMTAGGPLPELKRSDHEVNHSPPLIVYVLKNMCVHFSMYLHDVKRGDLAVIIIFRIFCCCCEDLTAELQVLLTLHLSAVPKT